MKRSMEARSGRVFLRCGARMYAFALGRCAAHCWEGGALFLCLRSFVSIVAERPDGLRTRAERVGRLASLGVCLLLSALLYFLIAAAVGGALVLVTGLSMALGQWIDRIAIRKRHTARKWLGKRVLLAALVWGMMGLFQLAAFPLFLAYCLGAGLDMASAYAEQGEAPVPASVARRWPGVTRAFARLENPLQVAGGIQLVRLSTLDGMAGATLAGSVGIGATCLLAGFLLWGLVLRLARARWWSERCQMAAGLLIWAWGAGAMARDSVFWMTGVAPLARPSACVAGLAVCMTALSRMRARLVRISAPDAPRAERAATDGLWRGELVGLACLAYMALREPLRSLAPAEQAAPGLAFAQGVAPLAVEAAVRLMMIPCLIWMAVALARALRYPMDARYARKLRRYEAQEAQGIVSEELRRELEQILARPYAYRWGLRLLAILLRTAMPHRIVGMENLSREEAVDAVLLCNHGEWYGPVAAYLFVPFPIRPWTDDRVSNPARSVEHVNRFTLAKQAWLPEAWRMPLARGLIAPLLRWVMTSVNGVPVYRNHPAALVKTFRASMDALRAGDTLLIFPENPDDPSFEKGGYVREGVGPWFSGIGALGRLHHRQTGNPLLFVPMYASKRNRTISVGEPEAYDGGADPVAEAERLVQVLHARTVELACAAGDMLPPMAGNSSVAL